MEQTLYFTEQDFAFPKKPVPLSSDDKQAYKARIKTLLQQKDAVLVAHYYTDPEIQALAEETGVIYPLTQWVLKEAVATIAQLAQAQLVSKIAVNISSKDLLQDELIDTLEFLFDKYKVKPQQLMLELKEQALIAEPARAMSMMQRLHRLGVELALDDFGTGFSSLAYLRKLPIQHVKVDCSFISELHKSDMHSAITGAIIDMARNLDLGVIAEGVEEVEVEQKLLRMGCQRGQGFLYSRPFELSGFAVWLKQWQQANTK